MNKIIKWNKFEFKEIRMLFFLALAGLLSIFLNIKIPHTEVLIEGRWTFGFIGFALLKHKRYAVLLAAVLSLPLMSEIDFFIGFFGNLSYAFPCLILIRTVFHKFLKKLSPDWKFGLLWFIMILFCYQIFITPFIWIILAMMTEQPLLEQVLIAWKTQPYFVESLIVGSVSASVLVAVLSHQKMKEKQKKLVHLNRILLSIRNVNQLIVQENDAIDLIQKTYSELIKTVGFDQVLIILIDEKKEIETVLGCDEKDHELWQKMKSKQLPSCLQKALDSNELMIEDHQNRKNKICLCQSLRSSDRTFGLIRVCLNQKFMHDKMEIDLFQELISDLSFALSAIKKNELLKITQMRYQELFEKSRDGFVVVDKNGRIIDANSAYCEMLGFSLQELIEKEDFYEITPKKWRKWEREEIWENRLLKKGYSNVYEKEYIRKDGSIFPVELQSFSVLDKDGELLYLWGIARDITSRKNAEKEIKEYREHLEELVEARTKELQQKNLELKKFNNLFIGRELRIKELKDKVRKLEQLLENNKN